MKNYYLEQVRTLTKQLQFAKVGYIEEIRRLVSELEKVESVGETDKYLAELKAAREAIASLENSLRYVQENYETEVRKGENH